MSQTLSLAQPLWFVGQQVIGSDCLQLLNTARFPNHPQTGELHLTFPCQLPRRGVSNRDRGLFFPPPLISSTLPFSVWAWYFFQWFSVAGSFSVVESWTTMENSSVQQLLNSVAGPGTLSKELWAREEEEGILFFRSSGSHRRSFKITLVHLYQSNHESCVYDERWTAGEKVLYSRSRTEKI